MRVIKGFEDEDIVVSDFGEWVGKNYIDYKSEYKNNQKIIKSLLNENKQLKEKLDKYENPDDMTLYTMWCTEKVKDENNKLHHYKTLYQSLKNQKEELRNWLEESKKISSAQHHVIGVSTCNIVMSKIEELERTELNGGKK